jgi:hypothetical protein
MRTYADNSTKQNERLAGANQMMRFLARLRLKWARRDCRRCASILIMLGQDNGEAQKYINDAKDALYLAGKSITDELNWT